MLKLIKRNMPPIESYQVLQYEHEGLLHRIKLRVIFIDGSILHVKEYRFSDDTRKYAYNWTTSDGTLKIRWDNAEHWEEIPTHPHHKHIGSESTPSPSTETSFAEVLLCIVANFSEQNKKDFPI